MDAQSSPKPFQSMDPRRAKVARALAEFVEQPRSDDGPVGEARNQRDLLVGEGANFLTIQEECADQLMLL